MKRSAAFVAALVVFAPQAWAGFTELVVNCPDCGTVTFPTPMAINNHGQVVGDFTSGGIVYGFYYDGTTYSMINAPGATETIPFGINDGGDIVGFYYGATVGLHGFLIRGGTFQTVDYVQATELHGINNSGVYIGQMEVMGDGFYNDGAYHWIQVGPPPPGFLNSSTQVAAISNSGIITGRIRTDRAGSASPDWRTERSWPPSPVPALRRLSFRTASTQAGSWWARRVRTRPTLRSTMTSPPGCAPHSPQFRAATTRRHTESTMATSSSAPTGTRTTSGALSFTRRNPRARLPTQKSALRLVLTIWTRGP